MTKRELVAKTVMGEITLGDIFEKFEARISSVFVERNGEGQGFDYTTWIKEGNTLEFVGELEVEHQFPLDTKIKVREDFLEIEYKNETYTIILTESKDIRFDSLLP